MENVEKEKSFTDGMVYMGKYVFQHLQDADNEKGNKLSVKNPAVCDRILARFAKLIGFGVCRSQRVITNDSERRMLYVFL